MFTKLMELFGFHRCYVCQKWHNQKRKFCSDYCDDLSWDCFMNNNILHEYQDDECALCGGIHPTNYCLDQETGYDCLEEGE